MSSTSSSCRAELDLCVGSDRLQSLRKIWPAAAFAKYDLLQAQYSYKLRSASAGVSEAVCTNSQPPVTSNAAYVTPRQLALMIQTPISQMNVNNSLVALLFEIVSGEASQKTMGFLGIRREVIHGVHTLEQLYQLRGCQVGLLLIAGTGNSSLSGAQIMTDDRSTGYLTVEGKVDVPKASIIADDKTALLRIMEFWFQTANKGRGFFTEESKLPIVAGSLDTFQLPAFQRRHHLVNFLPPAPKRPDLVKFWSKVITSLELEDRSTLLDFFTPQENTQPFAHLPKLTAVKQCVGPELASIGRLAETRRKPDVESLLKARRNDPRSEAFKGEDSSEEEEEETEVE